MIFARNIPENQRPFLEKLRDQFFVAPNLVSYQEDFEGQKCEDGKFILGCCAGPDCSISNLCHEMAHFVELPIQRLLKKPTSGWGFSYGHYWEIGNQSGHEPRTDSSTRREMRVFALQHSLQTQLGIMTTIEELLSPSVYINSFSMYRPYKKDGKLRNDKEKLALMADEVSEMIHQFDFNSFTSEWFYRIEKLSDTHNDDE